MSDRLPVVSGQQLISALEKAGWVFVRRRGSHVGLAVCQPRLSLARCRVIAASRCPASGVRELATTVSDSVIVLGE